MQKILLVGGTFDYAGGKPSSIVHQMTQALPTYFEYVDTYNGGFADELHHTILSSAINYDVVIWMPNVPNDLPKMRDVKEVNPHAILISSKRNDNEKYSFAELINRALSLKSNLTIEFAKQPNGIFRMRVFDPLGTIYYEGDDIEAMVAALSNRAIQLTKFTRVPSIPAHGDAPAVPKEERFFQFARECSDIFHNLIQPDAGVTRFLGNMSFRCQNGFPSFRGDNGIIYVSRRNVDKRFINDESFVPTFMGENGAVHYFGAYKPSVDTPIQQRLYQAFPQMNYMIHAHCYIDMPEALTTFHPVPCGALEEVDEILNLVRFRRTAEREFLAINLLGHGCILMASDVKYFEALKGYKDKCFVSRKMPENIVNTFLSTIPGALEWKHAHLDVNVLNDLSANDYQFSMIKYGYLSNGSTKWSLRENIKAGCDHWTEARVNKQIFDLVYELRTLHCADRIFTAEQNGVIYFLLLLRDNKRYHFDAVIACEKVHQMEMIM